MSATNRKWDIVDAGALCYAPVRARLTGGSTMRKPAFLLAIALYSLVAVFALLSAACSPAQAWGAGGGGGGGGPPRDDDCASLDGPVVAALASVAIDILPEIYL